MMFSNTGKKIRKSLKRAKKEFLSLEGEKVIFFRIFLYSQYKKVLKRS